MRHTKRPLGIVLGASSMAATLVLVAGWIPAHQQAAPSKGQTDCNCTLPESRQLKLTQRGSTNRGEWCLTQQIYDAKPHGGGGYTIDAACPPNGNPDLAGVRDAAIPTPETPIKTFRLYIQVFREKNGANPAATQADVESIVASLNANYAPVRIQFVYAWRYVNNTNYRYMDTNEEVSMKRAYAVSPSTQLNIYVVTQNQGYSWGTFPWDPDSLVDNGGIVANAPGFRDPGTMTHEVGHCLGLWHVFHGVTEVAQCSDCYEFQGRSAELGDTTGDMCSDTGPTPINYQCVDPTSTDPCSGLVWSGTPLGNWMSYKGCGTQWFSPQQMGRMQAWSTANLTGWMVTPQPPATPGTPSVTKVGTGQVQVVWADNSSDEDTFEVQRETKSGGGWVNLTTVATVGANVVFANDAPGTGTFHYRVRAVNGIGASGWTAWTQIKL